MKRILSAVLSLALVLSLSVTATAASTETVVVLSDSGVTVDGKTAPTSTGSVVYTGAGIVYYESGKGSDYGEGTTADEHSSAEAAAHTVVTITQPGVYRISGTLSQGQIAIDLGEDACDDPDAVVTLILDSVDITCTVAPAVIFYNVYECGVVDTATATSVADTSAAGANVVLADGSKNDVNGSYVARIYKTGTTSKLHKYDGAFYSKMSMNLSGESLGTGELHITAANEGLDSELHLTINGGNLWIEAQNDGINTNEDFVSVTTINGGYLHVSGGLGVEGDGVDSNGFLTINGGTLVASSNEQAGDGGIDADMAITINGGTVIAFGTRNDAVDSGSAQAYMELSFASTQAAGSVVELRDSNGNVIISGTAQRKFQSLTFSSVDLSLDTTYQLYVNDVQQQYTGNQTGGMGGGIGGGMGQRPEGEILQGKEMPEGFEPGQGQDRQRPEGAEDLGQMQPPEAGGGARPDNMGGGANAAATGESTTEFILTQSTRSFSGVSDWGEASGKTQVTFSVNGGTGVSSVASGQTPVLSSVQATDRSGNTVSVPTSDVQLTIADVPSESFAQSCLLSEGSSAMAGILPYDDGNYLLTISVLGSNETYAGTTQMQFVIGAFPFLDVEESNLFYEAIQFVYDNGLMNGTGNNQFSPGTTVSRAMAITVFGRLADAQTMETEAFTDVEAGSFYASYVGWAAANNVVTGYGDGRYGPSDGVTRQQMCAILYNYAQAEGISLASGSNPYTDSDQIADWAKEAVDACYASGLLDGIATTSALNPETNLTRAELADMMLWFSALLS